MATAGFSFAGFGAEGYDPIMSFVEGGLNQYFDKKSESRAFARQKQLMREQYKYAQKYALNSPSWNVAGLRAAGLNPILAVSNGVNLSSNVPSVPSVASHKPTPSTSKGGARYDPLTLRQMKLLDSQIEGQNIKNKNEAMNRGLTGKYGAMSRVLSEVQDALPPVRPSDYRDVYQRISDSIKGLSNFLNHSPSKHSTKFDGSFRSDDTPPEMPVHSKHSGHVIQDGFDSRLWSRSGRKYDGQYRYKKREPWTSVFTR